MPRSSRRSRTPRHSTGPGTSTRSLVIVSAIVVLVGVPVLVVLLASRQTVSSGASHPGPVVPASSDPHRPAAPFFKGVADGALPDGVGCSHAPETQVRFQSHIDLFSDGKPVTVPGGIGVLPTCAYWVRTESAGGLITVGSPQQRAFDVGDFFDIWGAPLSRTQMLSFTAGPGTPLRAFVDGKLVKGDPRTILLQDQREIALVVGRRPPTVPSKFP